MAEGGGLFLDPYYHEIYLERSPLAGSQDIDLPTPVSRMKDKKPSSNAKRGKQQKERRKMREKRRATGIQDVEIFSLSQADEDEDRDYSIDFTDGHDLCTKQAIILQSSSVDSGVSSSGNVVDARSSRKVERIRTRRQQEEDANKIPYTSEDIETTTERYPRVYSEKRASNNNNTTTINTTTTNTTTSSRKTNPEQADPTPCEQCQRLFDKERREKRKSDRKLREADHTVEMLRHQVKDIEKDMEELEVENDDLRQANERHQKTILMLTTSINTRPSVIL